MKFAIVYSHFNYEITSLMLKKSLEHFQKKGFSDTTVCEVPGAFELPLIAKVLAESGKYAAVQCIGCVIRGETSHYDYVCLQASSGILQASLETKIPIIFSVLTTEDESQAYARIEVGTSGAAAAIHMASLLCDLKK
jgi:6,7-dimethyl-8-ribityllumazine synthase